MRCRWSCGSTSFLANLGCVSSNVAQRTRLGGKSERPLSRMFESTQSWPFLIRNSALTTVRRLPGKGDPANLLVGELGDLSYLLRQLTPPFHALTVVR